MRRIDATRVNVTEQSPNAWKLTGEKIGGPRPVSNAQCVNSQCRPGKTAVELQSLIERSSAGKRNEANSRREYIHELTGKVPEHARVIRLLEKRHQYAGEDSSYVNRA